MISLRQTLVPVTCCLALTWLLLPLKISFLVGTQMASFSLAHCLVPLIGLVTGGIGALAFFSLRTLFAFGALTSFSSLLLACHLPTLASALYLAAFNKSHYSISTRKKILLASIAVSCMILFNLHPVGAVAGLYSLFWLIPLASLALPHQNLFIHMLGSTFTAHAVGSVIWLYAGLVPNPETWLALIPVVVLERILFASGMFVGYTIFIAAKKAATTQKLYTYFLPKGIHK